ncbi:MULTISPECIES: hypothetical protein [Arthrobacter]|uniref:Uncharacterized protein n=3 Tax=Arthrobacter TaxID=1663 RepID=A0A5N6MFT6_9MICC|nr:MULTISPECIES: hypothetical protein [Arthrobacter]KAD3515281.1 hypothetical protein GD627_13465 [Arthrobacter yangruifuii]MCC3292073.1 hypothetical protein [Arthrobacter sp. zg-Y1110]MCC3302966.1 hypothetical protein [Arthrobacter sp. zg-Y895]MCQ1951103.1 hypothetical protein [Arthrobacter jinronghuae]MCQ1954414.1 hypothetical protein [Arthrobacter sp. zg-Y238]
MVGTRSKQPSHSGEGHLVSNILIFAVMFAIFLGAIYAVNWLTLDNVWPMAILLVAATGMYLVAFSIGRSDTTTELAKGYSHNE